MYVERKVVSLTADGTGAATGYTPTVTGRVVGIAIVVPGANGIDNTADFTITAEATGEPIVTITNQNGTGYYYPRSPTHDTAGATALYAAAGTNVRDAVHVANDRVKIVLAQGGAGKQVDVHVLIA